ncbi:hypothetical protein MMSR116_19900 [Methylobacterium mesophilicum SR1.6/6]|uniref:Porin n=1 Tax=Methylobacterium mesophilicum SR1.6/6 TaxID=908290 RepID=A0A6B9FQ85_9HYPH|nr:hypothetical protein [Methylobacterium mesophilicum]QGY03906.1 hypothetical protein MMSR116_19900 [Methylobacterium mesophilicum SR1.6/6]
MNARTLAALLALSAIGPVSAAEQPRRSKLCPEDLPEGVRLPPQPGCGAGPVGAEPKRRSGEYDLGDGTTLRFGGRVTSEFGVRR